MKVFKKYLSVYGLMWKQVTDYRFEFVAELVCTLLPVFALYFLWDSVFSIEGSIKGMSFNEMILYIILARFVAMVITPDFIFEIMDDIQSGEIQHFICKPINYIHYSFVKYLASKSEGIIFCTVLYSVLLGMLFGGESYWQSPMQILLFFIEVFVAMVFYFQMAMVIGLCSFWVYEISSWYYTLTFAIEFLAGGLFPLTLLPDQVRGVCKYLPFQYMIYYPAQTLLMDINRDELVLYFFVLTGWIVVFALLLKILWRNGIKHYELIGG